MEIEYSLSRKDFIEGSIENKYNFNNYKKGEFIENYVLTFILSLLLTLISKEDIKFFLILYIGTIIFVPIIVKKVKLNRIKRMG